jgi:HD-like signal output (HDOD) protein
MFAGHLPQVFISTEKDSQQNLSCAIFHGLRNCRDANFRLRQSYHAQDTIMTDSPPIDSPKIDPHLERALLDIEIPPCPDILVRIMNEMHREEPDYHRLSNTICADVALSAGLIKTTNSPFFLRQQRARTVHDALSILGLRIASHTIAGIILRNIFPNTPSMVRFWDASARTARLCAWLAHRLDIPGLNADDAYTFGLFHDCGIPVLMQRFPNYKEVLGLANQDIENEFTTQEEVLLRTNHALVGSALAKSWWLDEDMCLAIRHHHSLAALASDSSLPTSCQYFIATARFAEHFTQQELGLENSQEWPKFAVACLETLQIDEDDMEFLYSEAKQVVVTPE